MNISDLMDMKPGLKNKDALRSLLKETKVDNPANVSSSSTIITSIPSVNQHNEKPKKRNYGERYRNIIHTYQHVIAARTIQRLFRGYSDRVQLWNYGGKLMVSRVVKIQKAFRGLQGRKRTVVVYNEMLVRMSGRIKGMFRKWQSYRLMKIYRTEYLHRTVVKIQCLYRGKDIRLKLAEWRRKRAIKMSKVIQRYTRGYLGRRRSYGLLLRRNQYKNRLFHHKRLDFEISYSGVIGGYRSTFEAFDMTGLSPWEVFDNIMLHIHGTVRLNLALDIAEQLVFTYPKFKPGIFALKLCLLSNWSSEGKAENLRIDMLEELVGLIYLEQSFLKKYGDTFEDISIDSYFAIICDHPEYPKLPGVVVDTVSRFRWAKDKLIDPLAEESVNLIGETLTLGFSDLLDNSTPLIEQEENQETKNHAEIFDELEFMFFSTSLWRTNKNNHSCSMMVNFLLCRNTLNFGGFLSDSIAYRVERARIILRDVQKKTVLDKQLEVGLRTEVNSNIFSKVHTLITTKRIFFKDIRLSTSFQKILPKEQLSPIRCDILIYQAGEMLIVRGVACISPQANLNTTTADGKDGGRREIIVRPLILLSSEIKQLAKQSVIYLSHLLKQTQVNIRSRGQINNVSEYLLREIRIVTGTSRWNLTSNPAPQSINLRIVLPALEYSRREQVNLNKEQFACRILQKSYRGYCGRALFRRLMFRTKERMKQQDNKVGKLDDLRKIRAQRFCFISRIQSLIRGGISRQKVIKMKLSTLIIQCSFRIYRAKMKVLAAIKRRDGGPEIILMLTREFAKDGFHFNLRVFRCGNNYRLNGSDIETDKLICLGFFYGAEVNDLLDAYNDTIIGDTVQDKQLRIRPWQFDRVVNLIVSNVGFTSIISPVTLELGGKLCTPKIAMVLTPTASLKTLGIEKTKNLNRILKDQRDVITRWHKLIEARSRIKAGKSKPSASMRFLASNAAPISSNKK
jgi:hypothetical protein